MFGQKQRSTLALIHEKLRNENFYWKVGYYALILAGTVHFGFLLLFLSLGIYPMAAVNVISVLIYWYCIFGIGIKTLERKDDGQIGWFVYIELVGHNVIATYYLGSDAGFQYYIYLLAAIPFFISSYSMPVYLFRVISALAVAMFLDMYGLFQYPKISIDTSILLWLYRMNILIAVGALLFLLSLYLSKEKRYHQDLLEAQQSSEWEDDDSGLPR